MMTADTTRFLAFDLGASNGRGVVGTLEHDRLHLEELHRFPNGPFTVPEICTGTSCACLAK